MKIIYIIIITAVSFIQSAKGIWPPPFKINLTYEETFIISDGFDDDGDDLFDDEDEMIKPKEVKKYNLDNDAKKYSMLHRMVLINKDKQVRNSEETPYKKKFVQKPKEDMNKDTDEVPWESGFVNKNGEFKRAKVYGEVDNLNEKHEQRRDVASNSKTEDYDYDSLRNEYLNNIQSAKSSNNTLNYIEKNEEDSLKDVVKGMVDSTKLRNCTVEERKGIGYRAMQCIFQDFTKPDVDKNKRAALFQRLGTIILVWIFVYLLVAIPCWCQRGWCCCCFQCKFCKPREKIDMAKKFLLDNPVGVYQTLDKIKIVYTPTNYEQYAQKRLEKALLKL